jgi:hypothetical protein
MTDQCSKYKYRMLNLQYYPYMNLLYFVNLVL